MQLSRGVLMFASSSDPHSFRVGANDPVFTARSVGFPFRQCQSDQYVVLGE